MQEKILIDLVSVKTEMERKILEYIQNFEEIFGVKISYVNLDDTGVSGGIRKTIKVRISVEIE